MWNKSLLESVGNTPLVKLNKVNNKGTILAKLEFLNPGFSIKSRTAFYILNKAEKSGKLKPGATIIDSSGGNTAIGMGIYGAVKGYKVKVTANETISPQKYSLLKSLGVEVVLCPSDVPPDSPKSAYLTARTLAESIPDSFLLDQFNNPDNASAHYETTGPEIWEQTEHRVDYLVAGMGTGGTISGTAKFLKEKNPGIKAIGVDPVGSVYYEYFKSKKLVAAEGDEDIEGIGSNRICKVLNFDIIDDIIQIKDKDAFIMARRLMREESICSGSSAGAAVWAAIEIAKKLDTNKIIVVILPDTGRNYLNTIFNDEWMKKRGFLYE
ncbi:MAG: cysteine synthase family protein [bacterium]|nr:cysteine synthase family protein [bacterium]